MSIGVPVRSTYNVEFIRGTGVRINGVVYSNYNGGGVNGPWTWVVPRDVSLITVDGVCGGGGGGGGWNTGTSLAGGGGGSAGTAVQGARIPVIPNSTLTITVGAGGTGGAAGSNGNNGTSSSISGIIVNGFVGASTSTDTIVFRTALGAGGGGGAATATQGGSAYAPNNNNAGSGGAGELNTASPIGGNNSAGYHTSTDSGMDSQITFFGGTFSGSGGGSGGGASTTGSVAGGNGGGRGSGGSMFSAIIDVVSNGGIAGGKGLGNTTGTVSRAGGGVGGCCVLGLGGKGGDGGSNGGNAMGYGAGGGGGGGGAAGGNGGDGYVKITYKSCC